MAEEIGFRLNVDEGNSKKSVKDFRAELKDAKEEAIQIGRQFGAFSPQAVEAARKLGALKDEMKDVDTLATNLTEESRYSSFAGFAGSLAGGFTAAQGAITLVTGESKKFEAAMLKVQGAMALSQGLAQVAELGKTWARAKNAVGSFTIVQKINSAATAAAASVQKIFSSSVDTTSKSFKLLRGAIIATGIGLLVVALGYVITNFEKIKEKVLNLIPGLSSVAGFFSKIIDAVTDFVGVTSDATRAIDKLRGNIEKQNDVADKNIQLMEASGATSKEVRKLKNQMYEDELNNLRGVLNLGGKLSEEENKRFKDLKFQQALLKAQQSKQDKDDAEAAKKKAQEDAKAAGERNKQLSKAAVDAAKKRAEDEAKRDAEIFATYEADQTKLIGAQKSKNQFELALLKAQGKDTAAIRETQINDEIETLKEAGGKFLEGITDLEREKVLMAAQAKTDALAEQKKKDEDQAAKEKDVSDALKQADIDARKESFNNDLLAVQEKYDAMKAIVKDNGELLTAVTEAEAKAQSDVREKWDKITLENKRKNAEQLGNILGSLSETVGKQTVIGKGLAIAEATISTYLGASKALAGISSANPFGAALAIAQSVAVVASGLKSVSEIVKVKVPGGGGGGGGSVPTTSPTSPVVNASPTMQGIQSTLLEKTNELTQGKDSMKAYVVESEITEKQERQRAITNTANF